MTRWRRNAIIVRWDSGERDHGGYYGVRKYALRTGKQTKLVCGSRQPDKYRKFKPKNTEWKTEYGVCVGETYRRQEKKRQGAGIGQ